MSAPRFASVEDYINSFSDDKAQTLRAIIDFILTEFPGLEVKLAWNVPQIHQNGKYVAGVDAFKKHITFSPWSAEVMDSFRPRLADYVTFKNCFHVPIGWEIDRELLSDMVKARLNEIGQ